MDKHSNIDLDKVADVSECEDWLRCPTCGSYDTIIRQAPMYIHFLCNGCDMHSAFEISKWS